MNKKINCKPVELNLTTILWSDGNGNVSSRGRHDIWWDNFINPFFEDIEMQTNGSVKIKPYHWEELTSPLTIFESVSAGEAEMGFSITGLYDQDDKKFSISDLFKVQRLDVITNSPSQILLRMLEEWPEMQKEWQDVKVFFFFGETMGGIATTSRPIRGLDDLKGMKILTAGSGKWTTRQLEALGAIPVQLYSEPDMREALRTGEVDGMLYQNPAFIVNYGFVEHTRYYLELPLASTIGFTFMNRDVWNNLSESQQKVFNNVFGETAATDIDRKLAEFFMESYRVMTEEQGGQRVQLSPKDLDKAVAMVKPIRDKYADHLDSLGHAGKDLIARLDQLVVAHDD